MLKFNPISRLLFWNGAPRSFFHTFFLSVILSCFIGTFGQAETLDDMFVRWNKISAGTETSVSEKKSTEILESLRAQLSDENEMAVGLAKKQGNILSEILSEIATLGPQLDGKEETNLISNKRIELQKELDREQQKLVQINLYSKGFILKIEKIDRIIRDRFSERLFSFGPSPLTIGSWVSFSSDLGRFFSSFKGEFLANLAKLTITSSVGFSLNALFWVVIGLSIILWVYPTLWRKIGETIASQSNRYSINFLIAINNLCQFILPLAGMVSLLYALNLIPIFGRYGYVILDSAPILLLYIVAGRWLGLSLFSSSVRAGQLLTLEDNKAILAARGIYLAGLIVSFDFLFRIFLENNFFSQSSYSVATLLIVLILSVLLFRLSRLISSSINSVELTDNKTLIIKILVVLSTYSALIAPFLTIFGFFEAGRYLIINLSISYFVMGASYVFFDIFINLRKALSFFTVDKHFSEPSDERSFFPVLVAAILVLINLPLLFLIWGGRLAELIIFWGKLNEGYALGSTQINLSGLISLIIIFLLGYIITKFLQGILRDSVLPKTNLEQGGQKAIVSGFGYIGNILAGLIAISLVGLDLSSLAIIAGALSVGLGFGMQTVVSNFVSGIILLIERPIQEGDWIEVSGYSGTVQKISVRATHLETLDKAIVVVPNSAIITGTVLNWMHGDKNGRVSVPVEVAYGSDPEKIRKLLLDISNKHPQVLNEPEPKVVFSGFGESALQFELRAYIDTKFGLYVKSDINFEIAKVFEKNKIEIPFPQRDINIRYPGGSENKS